MEVRRSAKTPVPPGVVNGVGKHSAIIGGFEIGSNLVAKQTNLPQQQRGDLRIRRIIEGGHKEAGTICALLMNVVNDLGKPLLPRSEEHTSELQSRLHLVCRLLLE